MLRGPCICASDPSTFPLDIFPRSFRFSLRWQPTDPRSDCRQVPGETCRCRPVPLRSVPALPRRSAFALLLLGFPEKEFHQFGRFDGNAGGHIFGMMKLHPVSLIAKLSNAINHLLQITHRQDPRSGILLRQDFINPVITSDFCHDSLPLFNVDVQLIVKKGDRVLERRNPPVRSSRKIKGETVDIR